MSRSEDSSNIDVFDQFRRVASMAVDTTDSYLQSPVYQFTLGRKGWKMYVRENVYLSVFQHPLLSDTLIISPEVGGNFDLMVDVLNSLVHSGKKVQLGRFQRHHFDKLYAALERRPSPLIHTIVEKEEEVMDWKFPARNIKTAYVAAMNGQECRGIRRANNHINNNADISIMEYSDSRFLDACEAAVLSWAATVVFSGKKPEYDMKDYYYGLFNILQQYPDMFDGYALVSGGEAVGCSIWEKTSKQSVTPVANVSKQSVKDLSTFNISTTCIMLNDQGVANYNMGASETEGLDKFKQGFQDKLDQEENSYKMQSAEVSYNNFQSLCVEEHILVP